MVKLFGHYVWSQAEPDIEKVYTAKLIYLYFHPLEVVFRYRDLQLQVAENYSYLFNLSKIFANLDF